MDNLMVLSRCYYKSSKETRLFSFWTLEKKTEITLFLLLSTLIQSRIAQLIAYQIVTGEVLGSNPGKSENFSMKISNWIFWIWIQIWKAAHRRSISWRNMQGLRHWFRTLVKWGTEFQCNNIYFTYECHIECWWIHNGPSYFGL